MAIIIEKWARHFQGAVFDEKAPVVCSSPCIHGVNANVACDARDAVGSLVCGYVNSGTVEEAIKDERYVSRADIAKALRIRRVHAQGRPGAGTAFRRVWWCNSGHRKNSWRVYMECTFGLCTYVGHSLACRVE